MDWKKCRLTLATTVGDAVRSLNESGLKIVLVVSESDKLEGTVSDGDIRRGMLRGVTVADPIESVLHRKPFVVPPEVGHEVVNQLMHVNKIQQVPIVDGLHRVVGLHLWDEVAAGPERSNIVIIMAGGLGTRLRPHTETCPKPLLPVAGKPMLEHIIDRARGEGFVRFVLAIQYLGHMIEEYFQNGERWGVQIDYLREERPMGTAGALSLLAPRPDMPFLVTNGDVLTDIQYGELLAFHSRYGACATMAVRLHEWQHPFGVVQTEGVEITGFEEKPLHRTHVNAGVYALEPAALDEVLPNERCDMPTLFERLRSKGQRTVAYPMHEPWLDVGAPEDLRRAGEASDTRQRRSLDSWN
ncbi:MAG: nucleotidyltransferase family protein [Leptospirales bacterium]|nr:nucleotidyltransferase family protein [Leptospirales bacterium]